MNILYLSLERNIELEENHKIMYLDYNDKINGQFNQITYDKIMKFNPDFLIEREFNDGLSKYPEIVSYVRDYLPNCKRAIWLIDSHCNLKWHLDYAPLFDYVFVAISKYKPIIAAHLKSLDSKAKVFWLPLCYPRKRSDIKRNKSKVPYDIVFVGRWGGFFKERTRLLDFLKEQYGESLLAITDYHNMEDYIRKGIISFNCSLYDDMNFRVFETMANGVELVTNEVPDINLISGLKDRINVYHSDQELLDICDDILSGVLEHDVIRSQIWIQNHHCLIHRHKQLLKMINTNEQHQY